MTIEVVTQVTGGEMEAYVFVGGNTEVYTAENGDVVLPVNAQEMSDLIVDLSNARTEVTSYVDTDSETYKTLVKLIVESDKEDVGTISKTIYAMSENGVLTDGQTLDLMNRLNDKGFIDVEDEPTNIPEL